MPRPVAANQSSEHTALQQNTSELALHPFIHYIHTSHLGVKPNAKICYQKHHKASSIHQSRTGRCVMIVRTGVCMASATERVLSTVYSIEQPVLHQLLVGVLGEFDHEHTSFYPDVARIWSTCNCFTHSQSQYN